MATTFNIYDTWRDAIADPARAAAISGTLKMALVTGTYTPDQAAHEFFDDITNEVSGTGYTAGGNACASPTWTGPTAGVLTFDADNPATWTQDGSGFSNARRAILYYDTGTAGTSRLVGYSNDFGADSGNVAGNFSITFDAAGIYTSDR